MQWSSQEFSPCRRTCIPYAAHQRLYQQGLLKTVVLLLPPLRSALANVFGVWVRLKYCSTVACISYLVPSLRRQSLDSHKSQYLVESGSTSGRDERQQLNSSPRVRLSKRFYNARQKRSVAVVFVATSQAGREVLQRTAKAVCGSWDARNCKPVNRTEDRSG